MTIAKLREKYHRRICEEILRIIKKAGAQDYPNNADGSNKASKDIAWELVKLIGCKPVHQRISGQTAGNRYSTPASPANGLCAVIVRKIQEPKRST